MLAVDESSDPEVVGDAQPAKHAPPLWDHRDALPDTAVGTQPGDVDPVPLDRAAGARNDAGDGSEQRRLSSPVAADDADPCSSRYLQLNVCGCERAVIPDL